MKEKHIIKDITKTYHNENVSVFLPTIIMKNVSLRKIDELINKAVTPSNIILRLNKKLEVEDENGECIPFKDLYFKLKNKIIPLLEVNDLDVMNNIVMFFKNEMEILDLAFISKNDEILKSIKSDLPYVRAILQIDDFKDLYEDVIKKANICRALGVLLPEQSVTKEDIHYIHARLKSVWLDVEKEEEFNMCELINKGPFGLVVTNHEYLNDIYEGYGKDAITWPQLNIAHRGLPKIFNENSLPGFKKATEIGASHIEIDTYLTTDHEVVILHDSDLSIATTGRGEVEDYSLEELKKFNLNRFPSNDKIPTLDEVLNSIKDSNLVVVLEIKSKKPLIIEKILEIINKHNFHHRVVSISFNREILQLTKTMIPSLPTACLCDANTQCFDSMLENMGKENSVIDTCLGNGSKEFNLMLKDRGILGWFWTFDTPEQIENIAISNGYIGITNDIATVYNKKIRTLYGVKQEIANLNVGDEVKLEYQTYDGEKVGVNGKVFKIKEEKDSYQVIAKYDYLRENEKKLTYFTTAFEVKK